jgi:Protein of unknown function (DUF1573)
MVSSDRLTPGEKGKVSVTVNLKGRSGSLTKIVYIYTNDPRNPVTKLSVRADVKQRAGEKP